MVGAVVSQQEAFLVPFLTAAFLSVVSTSSLWLPAALVHSCFLPHCKNTDVRLIGGSKLHYLLSLDFCCHIRMVGFEFGKKKTQNLRSIFHVSTKWWSSTGSLASLVHFGLLSKWTSILIPSYWGHGRRDLRDEICGVQMSCQWWVKTLHPSSPTHRS